MRLALSLTILLAGGCGENVWEFSLQGSAILVGQPSHMLYAHAHKKSTLDAHITNLNEQRLLPLELTAEDLAPGSPRPPFHALQVGLELRDPIGGVGGNRLRGFTAAARLSPTDYDWHPLPASWTLTLHQIFTDTFEEQTIDDAAGKEIQTAEGVFAFTLEGPGGEQFHVRDGTFDITAQSMNCIPQVAHSCQF